MECQQATFSASEQITNRSGGTSSPFKGMRDGQQKLWIQFWTECIEAPVAGIYAIRNIRISLI